MEKIKRRYQVTITEIISSEFEVNHRDVGIFYTYAINMEQAKRNIERREHLYSHDNYYGDVFYSYEFVVNEDIVEEQKPQKEKFIQMNLFDFE